jgi:hypothetical protein
MPDSDIREDIRHVLALVGGELEVFVDILLLDDREGIGTLEEFIDGMVEHLTLIHI